MSQTAECEICGSKLDEDGNCPSCRAQREMEGIIGEHEARLAGDAGESSFPRAIERGQPVPVPSSRARDYLAFDIEIARVIPDTGVDWKAYRPFGITCAATLPCKGEAHVWHGTTADGRLADQMTRDEVIQLVRYLEAEAASGKTILTWNGAGFDFDVLAEESGLWAPCARLAYQHVDMMFHFFCLAGFALGLDKAAKGMGLPGKLAGISGADAPILWKQGRRQEVLQYVQQDVVTTLEVCQAVESNGALRWKSKTGNTQSTPFPNGWLTVAQAQELPLPDMSWMSRPWSRSKFTGWMARHTS